MDADERLTALKKAYADIILNTAKEAAARIMVSESKAVRFQHELGVAKDEALQMLIRLKQMMDFKVREADVTSLNQKKKIEELEAQLQEAEDIVRDLRDELREVQARLDSAANNKLQHLCERDTTFQEKTSEGKELNTSHFIVACELENSTLNQRNDGQKCFPMNNAHMRLPYVCNHDLPSIIMRSKEPELYRNGCTQRIRAFEKNLLDEELSLSEQIDDVKNEKSVKKDETEVGICKTPIHEAGNTCTTGNETMHAIKSFRKKRKRAPRYKKSTTPSCTYISDQVAQRDPVSDIACMKLDEGPSLSEQIDNVKNEKSVRKDETEGICETLIHEAGNLCTIANKAMHAVKPFRKKRKRSPRYKRSKTPSCTNISDEVAQRDQVSDISCMKSHPNSVSSNATYDEDPSQMPPSLAEKGEQLRFVEIAESEPEIIKASSFQGAMTEDEDRPLLDKIVFKREENGSIENSEIQVSRIDHEKVEVPLQDSESKPSDTTNEVSSQPLNDRIIKYTLQRKRKRELSSNSDGNASLEESTLTRNTGERQNGSLGPQKSSSLVESTRDSRRLAQVARQLISLSEKKWWQ